VKRYLGALIVLTAAALAACSGGGSSGGSNPLAGVVVVQATPSPVPTATPVPTQTPEAEQNVIADPSFATEGAAGAFNPVTGWSACSIPQPAVGSSSPMPASTSPPGAVLSSTTNFIYAGSPTSFTGNDQISSPPGASDASPSPVPAMTYNGDAYSALTYTGGEAGELFSNGTNYSGETGANGICQTFTVPTGATFSVEVWEGGTETGVAYGAQEAYLLPQPSGSPIPLFVELNDTYYSNYGTAPGAGAVNAVNPQTEGGVQTGWIEKGPYTITAAPYNLTAGQSVELFIGTEDNYPELEKVGATKAGYGEFMFIDNVDVNGIPVTPAAKARHPVGVRTLIK
jgi:hypothetical protein